MGGWVVAPSLDGLGHPSFAGDGWYLETFCTQFPLLTEVTPWDWGLAVVGHCCIVRCYLTIVEEALAVPIQTFFHSSFWGPLLVGGRNPGTYNCELVLLPIDRLLLFRAVYLPHRNQPMCGRKWRVQPSVLLHPTCHQVWLPHWPGAVE